MLKKLPSDKVVVPKMSSFFFLELQLISFTFDLQFLYGLEHKVRLFKTERGIFHFQFRFVFIEVYIFVQQNVWTLHLFDFKTS